MTRRALALAVLVIALTGCGPTVAIHAGLEEAGSDILFGHPPASPAPPPVQLPQSSGFPAPIEIPAPLLGAQVHPATPPPVSVCPAASPFAVPPLEASGSAVSPPVNATYAFRFSGSDTIDPGKPDQKVTSFPVAGTRQVTSGTPSVVDGDYTITVVETIGEYQVTNGYVVYPSGHVVSPAQPSLSQKTPDAGIYLTSTTTSRTGQKQPIEQFTPEPPIQIDAFDDTPGETWQGGAGTDPVSQTTWTVDANANNANSSVVTGRVLVNACGTVVQAWEVKLAGTISQADGSGTSQAYTLVLDIANQYGGISVQDHLTRNQTDPATGKPEVYDLTATIDEQPKPQ